MAKKKFKGKLVVFTAPSGSGKTTVVRHLLKKYDFLGFSVSATSRKKRKHEIEGKDYYFLSKSKFKKLIATKAFIEWEEVYKNQFYGTLFSEVQRNWDRKKHLILDIDVKGASNIKKKYGKKCLAVFIRPPSLKILKKRLKKRNTEDLKSLKKRFRRIKNEMSYENKFDTIIVNDLLEVALKEAEHKVKYFLKVKQKAS